MLITAETLKTYDHLRAAHPTLAPEMAFEIAQNLHLSGAPQTVPQIAVEEPAVPEWVELVLAPEPEKKRVYTERKMAWTAEAKNYVTNTKKVGISIDEIARNLTTHFGLKNVTGVRVAAMADNIRRQATGYVDPRTRDFKPQMRVSGGSAGL